MKSVRRELGMAGMVLNAVGTVGLAGAIGQAALGFAPAIALGLSTAALVGSGLLRVFGE